MVKSIRKCDTIFLERMSFSVDPGLKLRWTLTRCALAPCSMVIFFPLLGKRALFFTKERTLLAFSEEMPSSFQMISPNVWGNASGSASVSESIVISRIDTVK